MAFPEDVRSVVVRREGKSRVVAPSDAAWDDFFDDPGLDLPDRDEPPTQGREPL